MKTVKLADIFEIARGGSPRPIDNFITNSPDGVNWIMIGDAAEGAKYINSTKKRIIKEGVSRSRMVKPGDFLLTNSMSFGRPYILNTSGCIHDGWLVLSPRANNVSADYFYYLLGSKAVFSEFERVAAGATVKNLNIDLVKGVQVPLPPLTEQKRIAAILDAADALRAKRRRALARLDDLARSLFLHHFGDPVSNPKGWPVVSVDSVADSKLGKMLDAKRQTGLNARPYLRNANVRWFDFDLSNLEEMDFDEKDRRIFELRDGDILMCEGGEPGRSAIWRGQHSECYYQKALHRIRPNPRSIEASYFVHLFWHLSNNGSLGDHVTSATIAHLTNEKLKLLKIPLPPPLLQQRFARELAAVETQKARQRDHLAKLDTLFASLQDRAFSGKL